MTTDPATPTYAAAFHCIGPQCEDHCCGDWTIPLDEATYASYQTFPAASLGKTVKEYVFRNAPDSPPGLYANLYRAPSGNCPFLGTDRLCQVQQTYGPLMLSATCSIYPRSLSWVAGQLEGSLSMSCPEAARQVLLDANFLAVQGSLTGGAFRTDNTFYLARGEGHLRTARRLLFRIVRERSRSVRERLLLIGGLALALDRSDPAYVEGVLSSFESALNEPATVEPLRALPRSAELRLELVLALSNRTLADPDVSPRFRATFWTFIEGIGSADQSVPGDDLRRLADAEEHIYQPVMAGLPHLLENYLLNYMLQHLFPFGRSGSTQFETRSCSAEWVLLALQFAWVETLLIGIAAERQQLFTVDDVIRTIQVFTRATEHDPTVLEHALEQVALRGLNNLEGMACLL